MTKTVIVLPESDDRTLCVLVSGVVTARDFIENFVKPLLDIVERHGEYNLCAFYNDYQGWEEGAADISFKYYSELGPAARRSAYVNAPDSRHLILKMMQPIMPKADIRFFDDDQHEEAIAWAKGGN